MRFSNYSVTLWVSMIDYDRAASIYENWLVIDGVDSQLGPSFWSIGPVKDSGRSVLSQVSFVYSYGDPLFENILELFHCI